MSQTYEFCRVTQTGHILEVEINRPETMNALHPPAHDELAAIWDEYERDTELWVAILTGVGERAFSSGNDLKYTASGKPMTFPESGFAGLANRFSLEKPIIAAVNGLALGGGFEIVLACDIVIAADHAQFGLPEVKVGLFAGAGGLQRLPMHISPKIAREMIFTGRSIDAERACELGLVNRVVPAIDLKREAMKLAELIASNSPTSIRLSKRILNGCEQATNLKNAMALTQDAGGELMQSQDFKEGVQAFMEKRKPDWKNV